MATHDHTGGKLAIVGCAGVAAWLLLSRGKGWGFRLSGDGRADAANRPPARRVVWVRADRIDVDGIATDLASVIAKSRASGEAEVHASGDAIMRSVRDVILGLRAAGVTVQLAPDLARTTWETL